MRTPYESELNYFKTNPNISGMATEDKRIIINPFSKLDEYQQETVARNEAVRLWMKDRNIMPDFQLTDKQKEMFKGTPYERDEVSLKHSIISRIITGDPSFGDATPEQIGFSNLIQYLLNQQPQ